MRRVLNLILSLCLFSIASFAEAQTGQPASYRVDYYASTGTTPLATETIAASAATITCNQPVAAVGGSNVNPTKVLWEDPSIAGRDCVYTAPATSPLRTLGVGEYEATLTAINDGGSATSARVPFSRRSLIPAVPTRVRVSP